MTDPRIIEVCRDALRGRGAAGEAALLWLQGALEPIPSELRDMISALGAAPLVAPPAQRRGPEVTRGPVLDLRLPPRLIILGDVHGRWDVVSASLQAAGVIDAQERWIAPTGTCLVQVGDLLDADLERVSPPDTDPDGALVIDRFSASIERALAQRRLSPTRRQAQRALLHPQPSSSDAQLRSQRLALTAAALVQDTLRAFERLEREAQARGGRVVVMMGNHELDLLSGRCWWMKAQKRCLLEQLTGDARWSSTSRASSDLLNWLSERPLMLRVGPLLITHGGPTRSLTETLEEKSLSSFEEVARWITEASRAPFDDDFYAEGRSFFSPHAQRDDFIRDSALLSPWLIATSTSCLIVGHSPFLGIPGGLWVDTSDPRVAHHTNKIHRMGSWGNVIKVDTNLKRAPICELLIVEDTDITVWGEGQTRSLLQEGEASIHALLGAHQVLDAAAQLIGLVDAHRGPELIDLEEPGIDSSEFEQLMTLRAQIESTVDEDARARLGRCIGGLLQAGPHKLQPLLDEWKRFLRLSDASGCVTYIQRHLDALEQRIEDLAALTTPDNTRVIRLAVDPRVSLLEGIRYRLLEPVLERIWRRASSAGEPLLSAIGLELIVHHRRPAVQLRHFAPGRTVSVFEEAHPLPETYAQTWKALDAFARTLLRAAQPCVEQKPPPRATKPPSHSAKTPRVTSAQRPAHRARLPRASVEALFSANAALFEAMSTRRGVPHVPLDASHCLGVALTEEADGFSAGWCDVEAPWRLRLVVTPDGDVMFADTTFTDPGLRAAVIELNEDGSPARIHDSHPRVLLDRWGPDEGVLLHAQLKPDVARLLYADEPDRLHGIGDELIDAPVWRRGCYLFTAPTATVSSYFSALNTHAATFDVRREQLLDWLELGWLNINLMISDFATPIDASARWGTPDISLEVVAIGVEGVRALWRHRAEASPRSR